MNKIFWGMIFMFFNFNIDLGATRIGLIPDFVGYMILLNGLNELSQLSNKFEQVKPYTVGMVIYTGVLYGMNLFGLSTWTVGPMTIILGIISTIVYLYISYHIVMGVKDIEIENNKELNFASLYRTWKVAAIFSLITYLLFWGPILAVVCAFVGFIATLCFIIVLNKSKNLYYSN